MCTLLLLVLKPYHNGFGLDYLEFLYLEHVSTSPSEFMRMFASHGSITAFVPNSFVQALKNDGSETLPSSISITGFVKASGRSSRRQQPKARQ